MSNGLAKSRNINYPQTMHDIVQASKYDSTILISFTTRQGVEALQLLLMVMWGSCDSDTPPKLSQIQFLFHNMSLCMVSLDVNLLVKNVFYSKCNLSTFKYFTSHWIQESLQFIHIHENPSHQNQVGSVHIWYSHEIINLFIQRIIFSQNNHTYQIYPLMIFSSVFFWIWCSKLVFSSQVITQIKFF